MESLPVDGTALNKLSHKRIISTADIVFLGQDEDASSALISFIVVTDNSAALEGMETAVKSLIVEVFVCLTNVFLSSISRPILQL